MMTIATSTPNHHHQTQTNNQQNSPDHHDYLRLILTAQVYDVAEETPLQRAPLLSDRLGCHVLLKREDLQPVFYFKVR
jgi:threonine dehydratase